MVIYAVFNVVFSNLLSSSEQTAFVLLLPVLKIAARSWINRSVQQLGDLKPEMIIFNAEIFHALCAVFSMQAATSRSTVVALIAVDGTQGCAMLRRHVNHLVGFCRKDLRVPPTPSFPWKRRVLSLDGNAAPPRNPQLLRLVLYILETDPSLLQRSIVRAPSRSKRGRSRSVPMLPESQQSSTHNHQL